MAQSQNKPHDWHQGEKHWIAHEVLAITQKVYNIDDILGCFFEWLTTTSSCLKKKWTLFPFPSLAEKALQRGDRNEANDKEKKNKIKMRGF